LNYIYLIKIHNVNKSLLSTQFAIMPTYSKFRSRQKKFTWRSLKVFKILLVMPATKAVSERSFSASKRVKTYLRATTLIIDSITSWFYTSINILQILSIWSELLEFCGSKAERKERFGAFSISDIISEKKELALINLN